MKKIAALAALALLAACATTPPPPPPPAPEPVAAAPEPAPAPAPAPEPPPPPPPEHPPQMEDGPWRVGVVSEHTRRKAEAYCKFLESYKLQTAIEVVEVNGQTWQRVVLPGLGTEAEAHWMVAYLAEKLGVKSGWVVPLKKKKAG